MIIYNSRHYPHRSEIEHFEGCLEALANACADIRRRNVTDLISAGTPDDQIELFLQEFDRALAREMAEAVAQLLIDWAILDAENGPVH